MRPTFRTLKIDDATALLTLVVEHAESLEAGLQVLDQRVLLGGASVDLVARDAEGRLVLVAVDFVASDTMMFSMLDAFAWCAEYPETLGRLYAVSPPASATAPRVMFISERVSDSFLRKVKYLRMPIDCLEFRYLEVNGAAGLYFSPVDQSPQSVTVPTAPAAAMPAVAPAAAPRPVAPAAPPPPVAPVAAAAPPPDVPAPIELEVIESTPVAAPRPSPPRPLPDAPRALGMRGSRTRPTEARQAEPRAADGRSAELLKGLRIPANLSSQWQRILNRAADAPDPAKTRLVREYLQGEFPGCTVSDFYEHKSAAQMFQVQNTQGGVLHTAAVSDEFFDSKAEGDIRTFLERERVARALRDAGPSSVLITASGLRVSAD